MNRTTDFTLHRSAQDRFGLRVAARLSAGSQDLPYDISERLRAARTRAVAQRRREFVVSPASQHTLLVQGAGSVALGGGDEGLNLWSRLASALPLLVLVGGLFVIQAVQNEQRAVEVAEVDTALLADDLPPAAYTDPGFAQYLKLHQE